MKNRLITIAFLITSLLPLLVSARLFFLKDQPVWPDEAIYTDTANNILQKGVFATNIFNGAIAGLERHAYWYPPLYFYLEAGWGSVFGFGIESVRSLSLLFGVGSVFIMFLLCLKLFRSPISASIGSLLLSTDLAFGRAARIGRMDMMNFFLILLALYISILADKGDQGDKRNKGILLIISGFVAGLAVVTHPLGVIAPLTVFLYLVINNFGKKRMIKKIILFSLPVAVLGIGWLISMSGGWDIFLNQYKLQMVRKAPMTPYPIMLFNSLQSYRVLFSVYVVGVASLFFKIIMKRRKQDIFILIGMIVSTGMLLWGKEMWYLLYFQPFISLGLLSLFPQMSLRGVPITIGTTRQSHYRRNQVDLNNSLLYTIWGLLHPDVKSGFAMTQGIVIISIIVIIIGLNLSFYKEVYDAVGGDRKDYHVYTAKIETLIPPNKTIFLASIPDPYFDLQTKYTLYEFPTVPVSDLAYRNLLDSSDFIVTNLAFTDSTINDYIRKNAVKTTYIDISGYTTGVVELVGRRDRK